MEKKLEVNVFNSNYKDSTFVLQKNPLGVVHGLLFCHRPPSYHRYIKLTDFCSHGICGGLLGCSLEANPCQINLRLKRCNQTLQLGTLWCSPLHLISFLTYCFYAKSSGDWASFAFCWRWRGHQSRLRSDSLKFTMPEEFPHKSTCFTSLSMELTFGQALGQCRNYW